MVAGRLGQFLLRGTAARPPTVAMALLADAIVVACPVPQDVEMEVFGVRRVRPRPQHGGKPAVKSKGAVEGPLGGAAVGEKGYSCAELGAKRETTVDQTLIRGLFTAFRVFVSGLSSV